MSRVSAAGWMFAGPALVMLSLFFFIPVLLAFALSLTDFDLYALASLQDLRFIGLQLEGGARISIKRKYGGPMVYYRTSF